MYPSFGYFLMSMLYLSIFPRRAPSASGRNNLRNWWPWKKQQRYASWSALSCHSYLSSPSSFLLSLSFHSSSESLESLKSLLSPSFLLFLSSLLALRSFVAGSTPYYLLEASKTQDLDGWATFIYIFVSVSLLIEMKSALVVLSFSQTVPGITSQGKGRWKTGGGQKTFK